MLTGEDMLIKLKVEFVVPCDVIAVVDLVSFSDRQYKTRNYTCTLNGQFRCIKQTKIDKKYHLSF